MPQIILFQTERKKIKRSKVCTYIFAEVILVVIELRTS